MGNEQMVMGNINIHITPTVYINRAFYSTRVETEDVIDTQEKTKQWCIVRVCVCV